MFAEARDLLGVFFYEKQLGKLREEFLDQALRGTPPEPDFLKAGEDRILKDLRREYYSLAARRGVNPKEADKISDEEDFKNRTQKMGECVTLMTHRMLAGIPYHGQKEYLET